MGRTLKRRGRGSKSLSKIEQIAEWAAVVTDTLSI
jgi:hypothetical protein